MTTTKRIFPKWVDPNFGLPGGMGGAQTKKAPDTNAGGPDDGCVKEKKDKSDG